MKADTNKVRGSGSLWLPPNSRNYQLVYYRHGKVYRESSRTSDERKARRLLQRRVAEAAGDFFVAPETRRIKVDELAEDMLRDYKLSGRKSTSDVKTRYETHLKPIFGHLPAATVTSAAIEMYAVDRQEEGAENGTINRELSALKRMFHLGKKRTPPKVANIPTFPRLAERNVRQGFVEDATYRPLAEATARVGVWMRAMFEVAFTFGWRYSEVLNLRVEQVNIANGTIRLYSGETKNDEGRVVVMTDTVRRLLEPCITGKKAGDHVFARANGKPVRDFRSTWKNVCEQAGVPGLLFHDLRRTAVRNMVRSGIPERVAMQISGHKTRSIFDRYNIVSERDLRDAARSMERRSAEVASAPQRIPDPSAVPDRTSIN
jgi:integrase